MSEGGVFLRPAERYIPEWVHVARDAGERAVGRTPCLERFGQVKHG